MNTIVVLCSVLALANAMTTSPHGHGHHHAHSTHEPDEKASIQFAYDHTTHQMAAMIGHKCYLYNTTPQEQTDVHTHNGIKTLEFQIIHMIENVSAGTTVTPMATTIAMRAIHHNIHNGHLCHDAKTVINLN